MKYFIVMVLIRIGTYEKSCTKLVRGNTQVEAENNALLGELTWSTKFSHPS